MTLALVDLGCGNVGSVAMALDRLGVEAAVTCDAERIRTAERVILPGVGNAAFAMQRIEEEGLRNLLPTLRQPVLGICLGMQLMFERSEEGDVEGLGILDGEVRRLVPGPNLTVPHMGWSRLTVQDATLGLATDDYVYFAHSFACDEGPSTVATAVHGRTIPAVARKDNFLGAQFHPEKSGPAGARFLEAFLSC